MRPFKRILAVVDPTRDEQPALQRAAMLAGVYNAELEIFASCYYSNLADIAADYEDAAQSFSETTVHDLEVRLEQLGRNLRAPGVAVSSKAVWHRSRHASILERAQQLSADLIVKDTHYHTAISRALFTNTDWSLIRESSVPLWLVRIRDKLPADPRIVVAIELGQVRSREFSMDEHLLLSGKELSRVLHGNLYAFHAFDLLPSLGDAATWTINPERLPIEKLRKELRAGRTEAMDALAGRHGISEKHRLFKDGAVTETLPGTAMELGASLVIIGAVVNRDSEPGRVGGTAEAVLDHVPCDLLVLRPAAGDGAP